MAELRPGPISPELCLVDPELAAWARLRGDEHPRFERVERPAPPPAPPVGRRPARRRMVPLVLAALVLSLVLNVVALTGRRVSLGTDATGSGRTELAWRPVAGAQGYDVILWRGGRRVLDVWPTAAHVTLPASWRHGGVLMTPRTSGLLWFVYPILSRSPKTTFGPLVASGRLGS
jgi:hypothetical protein